MASANGVSPPCVLKYTNKVGAVLLVSSRNFQNTIMVRYVQDMKYVPTQNVIYMYGKVVLHHFPENRKLN